MSNDAKISSSAVPLILALETSTRAGSVTLARGDKILASQSGDASSSHSTDLIENIDSVLRAAGVELQSVDLFAAAIGPGSFTGLRIGLATAKSLAMSLNRRCIGVSTLEAIAYGSRTTEQVVALLPAGRGEVFAQMFSVRHGVLEPLDEAAHISPQALLAKYGHYHRLTWAGEGAQAQLQLIRSEAEAKGIELRVTADERNDGWIVAPPTSLVAEAVAALAFREWRQGKTIDPQDLRANYVRASDAEIKSHA